MGSAHWLVPGQPCVLVSRGRSWCCGSSVLITGSVPFTLGRMINQTVALPVICHWVASYLRTWWLSPALSHGHTVLQAGWGVQLGVLLS